MGKIKLTKFFLKNVNTALVIQYVSPPPLLVAISEWAINSVALAKSKQNNKHIGPPEFWCVCIIKIKNLFFLK